MRRAKETHRTWWTGKEAPVAEALVSTARAAKEADRGRLDDLRHFAAVYLNRPVRELSPGGYTSPGRRTSFQPVRFPLVKSTVDTIHAKLTKNPPRTTVLTEDASFTMRMQAEKLESFVDGVKYQSGWRSMLPAVVRDAMLAAAGVVKVYPEVDEGEDGEPQGRVCIERVFAWELFVDPREAVYGQPRSLFQFRVLDRRKAMELWPEQADRIEEKAKQPSSGDVGSDTAADQVCVWEGWHLPSGRGSDDGRHVIAVEGVGEAVVDEEHDRSGFPFAILHWTPPPIGFWGQSLVEDIDGIHEEANDVAQRNQARASQVSPKLLLFGGAAGSSLETGFTNSDGLEIHSVPGASAQDAQLWSPPTHDASLWDAFDRYASYAQRFAGVSQLSVAGMKPSGLNSGVALREHQDIESERFASHLRAIEIFDLDVSRLCVRAAQELAAQGVPLATRSPTRDALGRSYLQAIAWGDISLDEDAYELKVWPSSGLPKTPAGRLAMVEQMVAAGFFGKEEALRLLDFPDIDAVMSEQLSPVRLVLHQIDLIMYKGELTPPIPEVPLDLARRMANMAIARFTLDRAPEDRIEMLRRYALQVDALQQRAEQSAAQAQGGPFVPGAAGQMQPGLPQAAAPAGQAVAPG